MHVLLLDLRFNNTEIFRWGGGGGGGVMRNMNILLGDILLIFILYSFSK